MLMLGRRMKLDWHFLKRAGYRATNNGLLKVLCILSAFPVSEIGARLLVVWLIRLAVPGFS